jgi:hypothetical protein
MIQEVYSGFRIPDLDFFPTWIPEPKKHWIPDPDPQHCKMVQLKHATLNSTRSVIASEPIVFCKGQLERSR